jgi:multidrug efflux pump subunit AcrA (membrane-fusion protein)
MGFLKTPKGKRSLWPFALIGLVFVWSCNQADTNSSPSKKKRELVLPVQIGKVILKEVVDEIQSVGNVVAEQRVIITSEVNGRIKSLPVEEGSKVKEGRVLALIDTRDYYLQVEQLKAEQSSAQKEYEKALSGLRPEEKEKLQAQVMADQSALDFAIKEQRRMEQLVLDGVVSQSLLDEVNDKVARAQETLRSSKAAWTAGSKSREEDILQSKSNLNVVSKKLEMAQLDLSKAVIKAPFDGVIISKKIEVGAYAGPGTPVLEMVGSSKLKAVLEIPQSYRNKLKKISRVDFKVEELGIKFTMDRELRQRVRVIPDASIFSGNIRVQVELPEKFNNLFPGLTLEALLQFDTRPQIKHVPSISLVIGEKGEVVYVVENGRAKLVPVRAFKEKDDLIEIEDFTHQLNRETQLILRGSGAVFPGVKVLLTNPEPKAKPPFNAAEKGKPRPKGGPRGT